MVGSVVQPVLHVARLLQTDGSRPETKRVMQAWSHHLFRERLRSCAFRFPGKHVVESEEPGTSKTCAHCGCFKTDLSLGDKVYKCSSCGVQIDRQIAGARNNFFAEYGRRLGVGWDGLSD